MYTPSPMRWRPSTRWDDDVSDRPPTVPELFAAVASDGFAVDHQGMQHNLWVLTAGLGALTVVARMADQGSMTVRPPGQAFPAVVGPFTHGHFLAPGADSLAKPRRSGRPDRFA